MPTLTKELAEAALSESPLINDGWQEEFLHARERFDFSSYDSVDLEAAEYLATTCTKFLDFSGLVELSLDLATALSQHNNGLIFGRITSLSPEVATALSGNRNYLIFWSLHELQEEAAFRLLSGSLGGLVLPSVSKAFIAAAKRAQSTVERWKKLENFGCTATHLSVGEAAALTGFGDINLNSVEELDKDTASVLSQCDGHGLELNGLKTLDADAATALFQCTGRVKVNGVTEILNQELVIVSKGAGGIELNSLEHLTPEFAAQLIERNSEVQVQLSGLRHLSVSAAKVLGMLDVERNGDLYLGGLRQLTTEVARALSSVRVGFLSLDGLLTLDESAAKALARCDVKMLSLDGLKTLSTCAAAALSNAKAESVWLRGLKFLEPDAAFELIGFPGRLWIEQQPIARFSRKTASILAKHYSLQWFRRKPLTALTIEVAKQFLEDDRSVDLTNYDELDDDAAALLATHKDWLFLDNIRSLSYVAAKSLSKHVGWLRLTGLEAITNAVAHALGQHHGKLDLSGITELSDPAAASLASHQGELVMNRLYLLSENAAAALAEKSVDLLPGDFIDTGDEDTYRIKDWGKACDMMVAIQMESREIPPNSLSSLEKARLREIASGILVKNLLGPRSDGELRVCEMLFERAGGEFFLSTTDNALSECVSSGEVHCDWNSEANEPVFKRLS